MLKINNKGYMLVEIILASAIAFGIGYFILQMVINLKNKNDDLFVETQTVTDQTIITNKIMKYIEKEGEDFDCSELTVDIDNNKILYRNDIIDIVNEYATIEDIDNYCTKTDDGLNVTIPMSVKQMSDKDFDVKLNYRYDTVIMNCSISVDNNNLIGSIYDDNGIEYDDYGWDTLDGDKNNRLLVDSIGTKTFFVKSGSRTQSCSVDVKDAEGSFACKKKMDSVCNGGSFNSEGVCMAYCYSGTESYCKKQSCTKCDQCYLYYHGACYRHAESVKKCSGDGWKEKNGACYNYDMDDCGSYEKISNKTCSDDYQLINGEYCYKIN